MTFRSITLISLVALLSFLSCNKGVRPLPNPIKKYASEKFGRGYAFDYNETEEYVILSKLYKIKPSDPFPTLRFELLEVSSMEVIFNDNIRGGKVSWRSKYTLTAEGMKGIPGPEGEVPKAKKYHYSAEQRSKVVFRKYK